MHNSGHRKDAGRQEHLEKGSGARNVDSKLQEQLEEDGGDSIRQSRVESSGL